MQSPDISMRCLLSGFRSGTALDAYTLARMLQRIGMRSRFTAELPWKCTQALLVPTALCVCSPHHVELLGLAQIVSIPTGSPIKAMDINACCNAMTQNMIGPITRLELGTERLCALKAAFALHTLSPLSALCSSQTHASLYRYRYAQWAHPDEQNPLNHA